MTASARQTVRCRSSHEAQEKKYGQLLEEMNLAQNGPGISKLHIDWGAQGKFALLSCHGCLRSRHSTSFDLSQFDTNVTDEVSYLDSVTGWWWRVPQALKLLSSSAHGRHWIQCRLTSHDAEEGPLGWLRESGSEGGAYV